MPKKLPETEENGGGQQVNIMNILIQLFLVTLM
jgi:hypothetical protein